MLFRSLIFANLMVAWIGPWFSIVNSFFLIGLDLTIRDKLHDQWNGNPVKIGVLILIAGFISYVLNSASSLIAVASVVAFCLSMATDSIVYQQLKNKTWFKRANGSNLAGAAVDSLVFPTIAFGNLMPEIVIMQFASKVAGGFIWSKFIEAKLKEKNI